MTLSRWGATEVKLLPPDRGDRHAAAPRVLPCEKPERLGREPLDREPTALDAADEVRGAPHVPGQRPGAMAARL